MFADAEFIWANRRNARCVFRHFWMGATRAGRDYSTPTTRKKHASQKPVELMQWLIESCRIGLDKVICDPYMGSGSTGVAAILCGRRFVGIEIDEQYIETAIERIKEAEAEVDGVLFGIKDW